MSPASRLRPAPSSACCPPENATGNFTKIVQRVPGAHRARRRRVELGTPAARPVGDRRRGRADREARKPAHMRGAAAQSRPRRGAPIRRRAADQAERSSPSPPCASASSSRCSTSRSSPPPCRISAADFRPAPDEIAWVQTSYLIAEIIVIPLSGWLSRVMSTRWLFCCLRGRLHLDEPAVRRGLGHPEHDRLPRAARLSRRLDDPDRVHDRLHLLPGAAARHRRGDRRRAVLPGAHPGPDRRRLDHRQLLLALAVLHQPGAGHLRRLRGADAGAHRQAGPVACSGAPTIWASR